MRIIAILLGFLLLCSFVGNMALGYLGVTWYEQEQDTRATLVRVQQTTTAQTVDLHEQATAYVVLQKTHMVLRDDYVQLDDELAEMTAGYADLQATATVQARDLNGYREALTTAEFFRSRALCAVQIEPQVAVTALSNADVRGEVLAALEELYADSLWDSRLETLWNNSQSAVLTVNWREGTTKTIIAWDENNQISSIYDIGMGCMLYAGDMAYE